MANTVTADATKVGSRTPAANNIENVMQPITMAVPRSGCLMISTAAKTMNTSKGRTTAFH